ncbi:MAG: hypothetical protein NC902_07795, partial [Candidatus Omnitrophica bacterium]|nr:hypothetical protein [Candidatus Omnitrophota bacterium]
MNLVVYLREKEFFFYSEKGISGVFESDQDIVNFLKENRVSNLTIVFSRPAIFIRTIEFPFSSLKKIADVVLQESLPLFPVLGEQLEFFWYVVSRDRSKATVSVFAFEKSKIEKWKKYQASSRFKMNICFEPFILSSYVSKTTQQSNFMSVFIDGNYISRCVVKNNVVMEASSLYVEDKNLEPALSEIISDNQENISVILIGEIAFSDRFKNYKR